MHFTHVTGKLRAAGLLICLTGLAVAQNTPQNTPQNTWIRVTTVKVKPEMVPEWRELEKNEIIPAYKKAGVPGYSVWQTSMFGDAYEYTLVMPIAKFEQFDGESPLVKAMKPEDRVRLGNRMIRCIVSQHSSALLSRADISIQKEGAKMADLIMVNTIQLQPKNVSAYMSYLKEEMKPVMEKAGVDWWLVYSDVFGAGHTQITTVRSMKNWAEIDAGPIARRLLSPPEYTRVTEKGQALTESSTIEMARLVKDLSY
jgi:hypothetical protein